MTERQPDSESTAALRFFGSVTASVSHELNNVNSAIEQIAGLLADHLVLVSRGGDFDPQRLQNVHDRIVRQTRRAADIIERLNRFAHSADDPSTRFELNGVLDNIVAVSRRLAELYRADLSFTPSEEGIWLVGDPFRLSKAVFECLRTIWEASPPGSEIALWTGRQGEDYHLGIQGPARPAPDGVGVAAVGCLADRLAGVVDERARDGVSTVTITWSERNPGP
jgi:signal transduction histidine kinase